MGLNVAALGDFNNEVAGKVLLQTIYKGNTDRVCVDTRRN